MGYEINEGVERCRMREGGIEEGRRWRGEMFYGDGE
jgi:hypothetical protein